jgi:hypothetical protein
MTTEEDNLLNAACGVKQPAAAGPRHRPSRFSKSAPACKLGRSSRHGPSSLHTVRSPPR